MNNFATIDKIEFAAIKQRLKDFLRSYHNFTDYDFEGSNISVLIDLLTYNTYNMMHYGSMIGSEAFLDSAQLRASIISHAKDLNYTPRSKTSARGMINIEILPNDNPSSITIPRFYQFRATSHTGSNLFFVTDQSYTVARDANGRYLFRDVEVFQGERMDEYFVVGTTTNERGYVVYSQDFAIASTNIDTASIEVFVYPDENSQTMTEFKYSPTIIGVTDKSNVFFLQGFRDNQYKIEFGDGVFGTALTEGNLVRVNYRNTLGESVEGTYVLSKTRDIQGYSNITIENAVKVIPGADREHNESIRKLAPINFQAQERAVVPQDYEVLIKRNFPFVQRVNVFGGEEIYQYGKVMIVIKPFGRSGSISNNLKTQIINYLKTKNIVPEPIILDPEYFYLSVNGNIFYNESFTSFSEQQVKAQAIGSIIALNDTSLGEFNVNIYQSQIDRTVKDSSPSITGVDVKLDLVRRWAPPVNRSVELSFTLNNAISRISGISSSTFYITSNGVLTPVVIQTDSDGKLYLVAVGREENSKVGASIGSIDYVTGNVKLNTVVSQYEGAIDIICVLENDSINIAQNKFVIADTQYINFNMVSR